jgi:uncharacterized protein with PhoU and TrkA domain
MTGATVIAMSRAGKVMDNPSPEMPMETGDILYLLGSLEQVQNALIVLETGQVPAEDPVGEATQMWMRKNLKPDA